MRSMLRDAAELRAPAERRFSLLTHRPLTTGVADQFEQLPEYLDLPSSREEAFSDMTQEQYEALWHCMAAYELGAPKSERER
jgi:hypothetical protein